MPFFVLIIIVSIVVFFISSLNWYLTDAHYQKQFCVSEEEMESAVMYLYVTSGNLCFWIICSMIVMVVT